MGDHVILQVDGLIKPESVVSSKTFESSNPSGEASCGFLPSVSSSLQAGSCGGKGEENAIAEEEEPFIQTVECRICQDEDHIKNLETPCACSGSLKYAHRTCVQRWCNEKGDITCEICHESYKPGYVATPRVNPDETTIDLSVGWTITGSPLHIRDPRVVAIAAAQHHFLEAEYDDHAAEDDSGAGFCRSAVLILLALLLLRHALAVTNGDGDDDASTIFSLFLLRAAGFLLPCYIMAWALSILQHRRQSQEEAALAATEVAFILQSGHREGLHFTIAPESPTTPQREPHQ